MFNRPLSPADPNPFYSQHYSRAELLSQPHSLSPTLTQKECHSSVGSLETLGEEEEELACASFLYSQAQLLEASYLLHLNHRPYESGFTERSTEAWRTYDFVLATEQENAKIGFNVRSF